MFTDYCNDTITIQKLTVANNSFGAKTESWITVNTLKGKIDYMSNAIDYSMSNKRTSNSTHVLMCLQNLNLDINEEYRVSFNGNNYTIDYQDFVFNHHSEIFLTLVGSEN